MAHSWAFDSPAHPHWLGSPPPPQASGAAQAPQFATTRAVPQVSVAERPPQRAPRRAHSCASVSGRQPQTLGTLTPQLCDAVQLPQFTERERPQESVPLSGPQSFPRALQNAASLCDGQPQTLATPAPPHVSGAVQLPQAAVRIRPQESVAVTDPQSFARAPQNDASDSGVQAHALGVPPPPQVAGLVHEPQLATAFGFPQRSVPLSAPQDAPRRVQKAESDSEQEHAPAEQVELPTQVPQLGTER